MKRHIVAACLTLAACAAMPNPVAHHGNDWVMLIDKPCAEDIAAKAPDGLRERLHAAQTSIDGKPFEACWVLHESVGAVILFYADGDQGAVAVNAFHDEPAI